MKKLLQIFISLIFFYNSAFAKSSKQSKKSKKNQKKNDSFDDQVDSYRNAAVCQRFQGYQIEEWTYEQYAEFTGQPVETIEQQGLRKAIVNICPEDNCLEESKDSHQLRVWLLEDFPKFDKRYIKLNKKEGLHPNDANIEINIEHHYDCNVDGITKFTFHETKNEHKFRKIIQNQAWEITTGLWKRHIPLTIYDYVPLDDIDWEEILKEDFGSDEFWEFKEFQDMEELDKSGVQSDEL